MGKYKFLNHIFITETEKYVFISVGEKNFKLLNNKNVNLRLRKAINDIRKNGETKDKSIEEYLLAIKAIVKQYKVKQKKSIEAQKVLNENSLSKELREHLPNHVSVASDSSLSVMFSKEKKGLFLYNKRFSLLDGIVFDETGDNYLSFVSEALTNVLNNGLDSFSKYEILHISLETYENQRNILGTSDTEKHFLLDQSFCDLSYDFTEYYPLVKANYINLLGDKYVTFGKNKKECKKNVLLHLADIKKYTNFVDREKLLKEMIIIDIESLEDAEIIFDFYFPEDTLYIDYSVNMASIGSDNYLKENNFNRLLAKYIRKKV